MEFDLLRERVDDSFPPSSAFFVKWEEGGPSAEFSEKPTLEGNRPEHILGRLEPVSWDDRVWSRPTISAVQLEGCLTTWIR